MSKKLACPVLRKTEIILNQGERNDNNSTNFVLQCSMLQNIFGGNEDFTKIEKLQKSLIKYLNCTKIQKHCQN